MPEDAAVIEQAEPSPNARASSAFDERMKVAQPMEVDNDTAAPVVPEKKVEPEPKQEAKAGVDDFPEHIIDGEAPKPVVKTDVELEGILPPSKMSQTAAAHWANLKSIAEKRGVDVARLTAELEATKAAKPAAADPEQSEAAKNAIARAAELELELERAAFERSPKYKELVTEGQTAIAQAKSYLEGTEVDPSVIDRAASLTGAKRLAVLRDADLDATAVGAIAAHLAEHDKLSAKRESLLAQHKTIAGEYEAQQRATAEAKELALQQQEEKTFHTVLSKVKGNFPALQPYEGNEAWNKQVEERLALAAEYYNGKRSLEETAEITIAGVAYAVENRRANILAERLKAAVAENAKLKAAQPGGGETNGQRTAQNGNGNGSHDNSSAAVASRFDQRLGL